MLFGVKRISVPWTREGSCFTLLFEQVILLWMCYVGPMIVLAHFYKVLYRPEISDD
jgi:hypothetical protein